MLHTYKDLMADSASEVRDRLGKCKSPAERIAYLMYAQKGGVSASALAQLYSTGLVDGEAPLANQMATRNPIMGMPHPVDVIADYSDDDFNRFLVEFRDYPAIEKEIVYEYLRLYDGLHLGIRRMLVRIDMSRCPSYTDYAVRIMMNRALPKFTDISFSESSYHDVVCFA